MRVNINPYTRPIRHNKPCKAKYEKNYKPIKEELKKCNACTTPKVI